MNGPAPLYLGEAAVKRCLPDREIFEVVESALTSLSQGAVVKGPKAGFGIPSATDHRHMGMVSGCLIDSQVAGVKWFVTSDKNASRGLPRVPATVIICDAVTGLLIGVLDATYLTALRTAAMAVSACLRARCSVPQKVAIIGAGAIGQALARYFATEGRVSHIAIAARHRASVDRAVANLRESIPSTVAIDVANDVQSAVAAADIVVTATGVSSDADVVRHEWLLPGALTCSLGSHREVSREVICQAAEIIVDDLQGAQTRGNLASEFRAGRLREEDISRDIGSLFARREAPENPASGRAFISLVGLGVIDVALGARALANARLLGCGIPLVEDEETLSA